MSFKYSGYFFAYFFSAAGFLCLAGCNSFDFPSLLAGVKAQSSCTAQMPDCERRSFDKGQIQQKRSEKDGEKAQPPAEKKSCLADYSCTLPPEAASLKDLILYGASINPSVLTKIADYQQAQAEVSAAIYAFGPTPSLNLDSTAITATLSQPLYSGNRQFSSLKRAIASTDMALAEIETTQIEVGLAIVIAYGKWMSAQLKESAWRKTLVALEEITKRVERRFAAGLATENETERTKSEYNDAKTEMLSALIARKTAEGELELAVGGTFDENSLIAGLEKTYPKVRGLESAKEVALFNSPFLVKAGKKIDTAHHNIAFARSRLWPTFSAVTEISDPNIRGRSGQNISKVTFLKATTDIGASFTAQARIDAAKAALVAAQENKKNEKIRLLNRIERDFLLLEASLQRRKAILEIIATNEKVLSSYYRQLANGTKTWMDIIMASKKLTTTQGMEADARSATLSSAWNIRLLADGLNSL